MRLKLILYLTLFFEKARALCKGSLDLSFQKSRAFGLAATL